MASSAEPVLALAVQDMGEDRVPANQGMYSTRGQEVTEDLEDRLQQQGLHSVASPIKWTQLTRDQGSTSHIYATMTVSLAT